MAEGIQGSAFRRVQYSQSRNVKRGTCVHRHTGELTAASGFEHSGGIGAICFVAPAIRADVLGGQKAIQFHDGEEVRGLRDALGAMTVASPWMRLHWLVSPEPRLGHGIPIEMLKQGQDKDLVRDAAELYAEQGAA